MFIKLTEINDNGNEEILLVNVENITTISDKRNEEKKLNTTIYTNDNTAYDVVETIDDIVRILHKHGIVIVIDE